MQICGMHRSSVGRFSLVMSPVHAASLGEGSAPGAAGIQPQYVLYGKMQELPNRGTSTYRAEFNLTNLKTREQVWTGEYIVKVRR